jgi:hypothetical protein
MNAGCLQVNVFPVAWSGVASALSALELQRAPSKLALRTNVFAQYQAEFGRLSGIVQLWLHQFCNQVLLASLRASRLGRMFLCASERGMSGPARFLCLTDDIEFQIAIRELHYAPIRHLQ